ncbi:flagellar basal body-associated FliL family protein [Marinobacterium sediminicola]|uniref:Flagellar protein FliL n=1 Tax=Marinobacterium sediminicola TaxID=518898 RepID=A0ABY1RYS4_9GAMM|nr:flagellar basal body-associated FliL family protein [Marinobacterium sediminicola]ULG68766.1 flagellar basal body-associated FliL family protein [Marinobacterium sediminicola]SMR73295.1 flagellar FliL protein [Marinobacterium sediminicola]
MATNAAVETESVEGGKGSKKKLIIILALAAVLLLGGGAGAAYFLLSGDEAAEQTSQAVAEPVRHEAIYTKVRTLEGKPSFVVTLQSADDKRHYLQAFVEAKSRNPVVDEALKLHMPLIVARLNALFSAQSFEDLQSIEGKKALRNEATALVQSIMQEKIGEPGVETILFTNFVMQ